MWQKLELWIPIYSYTFRNYKLWYKIECHFMITSSFSRHTFWYTEYFLVSTLPFWPTLHSLFSLLVFVELVSSVWFTSCKRWKKLKLVEWNTDLSLHTDWHELCLYTPKQFLYLHFLKRYYAYNWSDCSIIDQRFFPRFPFLFHLSQWRIILFLSGDGRCPFLLLLLLLCV